jgi:hypothetical protein
MNSTYTITEGNDALNRALLMMRYDLGKTLDENVISEQVYTKTTDGNYELKIGPFSGVDAAKIFPYLKQNEYPKKLDSYYSPIGGIPDDVLDGINKFRPSISPKPYQYTDFGYAKSNAYYPKWKKEWKQKNPGRKLGHEQQTLDKYGRASTVWVDEYGKESAVVVDLPTLSEWLLEVREFFFTPFGASLQVGLSIAGAEIGAPILFLILDGVIIINDAYMMVRDWDNNGPKIPAYPVIMTPNSALAGLYSKQLWEWFKHHFTTNIGFQNLIIDIAAILIPGGIFKLGKATVKSASKMFKLLIEKFGPNFMKNFVSFLEKFKPKTDGLPKELGSWVDKKYSEITKAIELWKTPSKAVKTVVKPKRLAWAGVAGAGTYTAVKWLESKSDAIIKFFESNPEKDSVFVNSDIYKSTDKAYIDNIREDNPTLFPKDFKIKSFKTKVKKLKDGKLKTEYYLINNVKYVSVDLTQNNLKVKKII